MLKSSRPFRSAVRLAAAAIVIGFITLMLVPSPPGEGLIWDKAAHAIAFVIIPVCLAILFPFGRLISLAAVSVLLGGAIEIVQGWVGRDDSWGDLAADAVGVLIAVVLLALLRAWKTRPHTPLSERRPD